MLIVVKLLFVAFAVFGQAKLFPEKAAEAETGLDSLILPEEQPELALVRRAIAAEGLCPAADRADAGEFFKSARALDSAATEEAAKPSRHDLAANCY